MRVYQFSEVFSHTRRIKNKRYRKAYRKFLLGFLHPFEDQTTDLDRYFARAEHVHDDIDSCRHVGAYEYDRAAICKRLNFMRELRSRPTWRKLP